MQATCPQCSNRITIDDARVPDRPFSVKCPKCQNVLKLPGKGAAAAPPAPAAPEPFPEPAAESGLGLGTEELKAQMMAQLRREMAPADTHAHGKRALVALADRGVAGNMTLTLTRVGYAVDTLDDMDEGARLLEQGVFELVVTNRVAGAAGKGESLYQRLNRLSPDARRRIFLILVGDEFKSGDGTQAWATMADLAVNTREVASADSVIRNTIAERQRLYQVYLDARHRHEAAAG